MLKSHTLTQKYIRVNIFNNNYISYLAKVYFLSIKHVASTIYYYYYHKGEIIEVALELDCTVAVINAYPRELHAYRDITRARASSLHIRAL